MAPWKRNRVHSTLVGDKAKRSELRAAPTGPADLRKQILRVELENIDDSNQWAPQAGSRPDSKRNHGRKPVQDPKLNGKLIPSVTLEKSASLANLAERGTTLSSWSPPSASDGDISPSRILRTKNTGARKSSVVNGSSRMGKRAIGSRKPIEYPETLHHVTADCKLNGGVAPLVVLRRLDMREISDEDLLPEESHYSVQNYIARSDSGFRSISRTTTHRTRAIRERKAPGRPRRSVPHQDPKVQKFRPVPDNEKKLYDEFRLKQVAVRLTKLPLLIQ
ncbi:uncharacterized protein LOC100902665 [Galendromus occidentalis]|uniref:Uncharacterized protein LOC100902665 n=1 Tax=Galendromus occidentalis TaxID=34638 RepID=A0AAJ6VV27_9ACAR|nr:uncharacterized protein LOC100902665 [Galendromus occidentalis]